MSDPTQTPAPPPNCHRFSIPYTAQEFSRGPKGEMVPTGVQAQLAFVACTKGKCSLWNAAKGECFDVTQAKALDSLAESLKPKVTT